jgi:hypothetical protein
VAFTGISSKTRKSVDSVDPLLRQSTERGSHSILTDIGGVMFIEK